MFQNCDNKKIYKSGTGTGKLMPILSEGQLLSYKTIGIADTTLSLFRGNITGSFLRKDSLVIENLPNASIKFKNTGNLDSIYISSDNLGQFQVYLEPGSYVCEISFYNFDNLQLRNIFLKSGEVKHAKVLMGHNETSKAIDVSK